MLTLGIVLWTSDLIWKLLYYFVKLYKNNIITQAVSINESYKYDIVLLLLFQSARNCIERVVLRRQITLSSFSNVN